MSEKRSKIHRQLKRNISQAPHVHCPYSRTTSFKVAFLMRPDIIEFHYKCMSSLTLNQEEGKGRTTGIHPRWSSGTNNSVQEINEMESNGMAEKVSGLGRVPFPCGGLKCNMQRNPCKCRYCVTFIGFVRTWSKNILRPS